MAAGRSAELLSRVHALEQRDTGLAAQIDALDAIRRRVDDVGDGSRRVRLGLETIPADRERAEQSQVTALEREAHSRQELADAQHRLDDITRSRRVGDEAKADAVRAVRRASVAAADAATMVSRIDERLRLLSNDEAALRAEAGGLAVQASEISQVAAEIPRLSASGRRPAGASLEEIAQWAARLHAALFVVRGGLEREREQVVMEANALAASVLGEDAAVLSVAVVRRRIEESLAGA